MAAGELLGVGVSYRIRDVVSLPEGFIPEGATVVHRPMVTGIREEWGPTSPFETSSCVQVEWVFEDDQGIMRNMSSVFEPDQLRLDEDFLHDRIEEARENLRYWESRLEVR